MSTLHKAFGVVVATKEDGEYKFLLLLQDNK